MAYGKDKIGHTINSGIREKLPKRECMNKKIFLTSIFCFVFSLNVEAGFFQAIGNFFSNLGNFLFGKREAKVTTFDRSPEVLTRPLDPAVRPCPAQFSGPEITEQEERWANAGFEEPDHIRFNPVTDRDVEMTHEMELNSVILRGSGWERERVIQHLNYASDVLAQCGIKVNNVNITEVAEPSGNVDFLASGDLPQGHPSALSRTERMDSFARRNPNRQRPVFVFVRDTGPNYNAYTTFADKYRYNNEIIPDELYDEAPRLNYSFVSQGVETNYPEFSSVAHELAHMLCQCDHDDSEPNLLSTNPSLGPKANYIPPSMCDIYKKSPLVRRINNE